MANDQQRVFEILPKLMQQLHEMDTVYNAKSELNDEMVKNWYFQHILVNAIRKFSLKQDVVLPKHLLRYPICFENDDAMSNIYRRLLGLHDPDNVVLGEAMIELKQAMKTQALDVTITDELTQWRISLNK